MLIVVIMKGNTPLHRATVRGNDQIAVLLMEEGSDVNTRNAQGRTCMHIATYLNAHRILERAIVHEGIVNAEDELGNTPLILLCSQATRGW